MDIEIKPGHILILWEYNGNLQSATYEQTIHNLFTLMKLK